MSSATSHFLIGTALAVPALNSGRLAGVLPKWSIPFTAGILASAPDLDLAGKRLFGVEDGSLLSHRGLFHSPFSLVILSGILAYAVASTAGRQTIVRLWLLWAGCMITHPLLDTLTDGGRGVMLLLPFSSLRIFFPWHPLHTVPSGYGALSIRAWMLRSSEIPFCLCAALIGTTALWVWRRLQSS